MSQILTSTPILPNPRYSTTLPSDIAAFDTGINERDGGCVVCGNMDELVLDCCHIIPPSDSRTWEHIRALGLIPSNARAVQNEFRNGFRMCASHHRAFDGHRFYVRWVPHTDEFVVVNHSRLPDYENIHGNVLCFDTNAKYCPFPTAFLWHEFRVRGYHPTHNDRPVIVKRCDGSTGAGEQIGRHDADACVPQDTNAMAFTPIRLQADNLTLWLQAARRHSSWQACVDEDAPWDGTAEENYERHVGILV